MYIVMSSIDYEINSSACTRESTAERLEVITQSARNFVFQIDISTNWAGK
jgi:hypothetical protein